MSDILPKFKGIDTNIIANVCGSTPEEYAEVANVLGESVDLLEINYSCPNVRAGCMAIGQDARELEAAVKLVKKKSKKPIMIKLSPNVTDIGEMARAAEAGGADAISLVNTFLAMKINTKTRRPINANNTGGLSGPAIKPIAVRMVWQAANSVKIPVMGLGGIMSGEDIAEFMLAGASLVSIGTANLISPDMSIKIKEEFEEYLKENNVKAARDLTGGVILN
jgi:dihydroorotate dehydrogenase (NAD+) catalytic subunit